MAVNTQPGIQQDLSMAFGLCSVSMRRAVRGAMQSYARFGPLQMAMRSFSAYRTRPLPGHRRGSGGVVLISALSPGACQVRQCGKTARAQAGDVFMLDVDQGFELDATDMETRALPVEIGFLRRHFPDYARFGGGLPGDSGLGRLGRGLLAETVAAAEWGEAQVARGQLPAVRGCQSACNTDPLSTRPRG